MTERRAITFYDLLKPANGIGVDGSDVTTVEYGVPAPVAVAVGPLVATARSVAASGRKPAKIRSRCCGKAR